MLIRPYSPADRVALLAAFAANTPTHFAPHEQAEFADYLDRFAATYLVLEDEAGAVCGGAGYVWVADGTEGQVTWIFLAPDRMGRGYGRALVRECLRRLREAPALRRLTVRTSQLAYTFFESFGYVLTRTVPDYWAPGLDLYEMARPADDAARAAEG